MSRRRSTGDLVPRDITEILAKEARAQRGKKKPGSSLGQAFSWMKGSKKKKNSDSGVNRTGAAASVAKVGPQNPDSAKTGLKGTEDQKRLTVHYTGSQHHQENVFIVGSRPQYLEDLHTEAQEGLKILQQEEHKNGVNFDDDDGDDDDDDESISSSDTLRPEQDTGSKDREVRLESEVTAETDDATVTSPVPTMPLLTHQGSTFKPVNPVKRLDKSRRRNRRTTIMGIPNQVQKELALHRNSTFQPLIPEQLPKKDGEVSDSQPGVIIIPTVDGGTSAAKSEGARVHLSELEATKDAQLLRKHLQMMFQNEHLNQHGYESNRCSNSSMRPKSLAVPGMTTAAPFFSSTMFSVLQESQGPVMSISPQATYLSTIIPNAILPASIEVIEIDRTSSRTRGNSIKNGSSAISKSPSISRRSGGDDRQVSHSCDNSVQMPSSVSGSNWSETQSSKTIPSNSSPASSKGSSRSDSRNRVGLSEQDLQQDLDHVSLCSSVSTFSTCKNKGGNSFGVQETGSVTAEEDAKNKQNFSRSLSVMKTRQPPAPPQRTNSLHINKIKNKSRVLMETQDLNIVLSAETGATAKKHLAKDEVGFVPGGNASMSNSAGIRRQDLFSSPTERACVKIKEPEKMSPEEVKFERTISPSSGYSSQSGTPTLSPKGIPPTSPDKQRKPIKPERSTSRASSSAASPFSSLTSLSSSTTEPVHSDVSSCSPVLSPQETSPRNNQHQVTPKNTNSDFRELLNIPPPPKVKAPSPPPPETWVHNRCTFEFLCGPYPFVNKETAEGAVKSTKTQYDPSEKTIDLVKEQRTSFKSVTDSSDDKEKSEPSIATFPTEVPGELKEDRGTEEDEKCPDVPRQEQGSSADKVECNKNQERAQKKHPPPVMRKPIMLHKRLLASTEQPVEKQQTDINGDTPIVDSEKSTGTDSRSGVIASVDGSNNDSDTVSRLSPPPTPPAADHLTPPSSVSAPPEELEVQEENHNTESCWPPPPPPPPPPLEGDSVFDGGDEVDFPPPPPPVLTEIVPDVVDNCIKNPDILRECTAMTQETGETREDQRQAETSGEEPKPHLPDAVPHSAIYDNEPTVEANHSDSDSVEEKLLERGKDAKVSYLTDEETSLKLLSNKEHPSTVPASIPGNVFLRPDILKTEDEPSLGPISNGQIAFVVPAAPPLPAANTSQGANFRKQPNGTNRDARSKELLSRHKGAPIPKEDANIPLVTPSLLQMVRLRSVSVTEDQVKGAPEDKSTNLEAPANENCSVAGTQNVPQKPIRKSLSLKSSPQMTKTPMMMMTSPSVRLQEAIRIKTAAMCSRDELPSRLGVRSSAYSCLNEKTPGRFDMHKCPASTASFIFAKSAKKVVIETVAASSPEAQTGHKQGLEVEPTHMAERSMSSSLANGEVKYEKVPPPVAQKPAHGGVGASLHPPACVEQLACTGEVNEAAEVQHTGEITPETTTTRVTADTIETLF